MKTLFFFACLVVVVDRTIAKTKSKGIASKGGYKVGRLPGGQFEYPELNGHYTPSEAAAACEADLQCAGFTFKGSRAVDVKASTFFFHYVRPGEFHLLGTTPKTLWQWTSYRVERPFVALSATFQETGHVMSDLKPEQVKIWTKIIAMPNLWSKFDWPVTISNVVGLNLFRAYGWQVSSSTMDFSHVILSNHQSDDLIMINLRNETVDIAYSRINCNESCNTRGSVVEHFESSSPITSRDCATMSPNDFTNSFVRMGEPVRLQACMSTCPAVDWTLPDLINTFDDVHDAIWTMVTTSSSGKKVRVAAEDLVKVIDKDRQSLNWMEGVMLTPDSAARMLNFVLDQEIKKTMVGPEVKDLSALAGLPAANKRISWTTEGQASELLFGAKAADTRITVARGRLLMAVVPVDVAGAAAMLSSDDFCKSEKGGSSGGGGGGVPWWNNVLPQLLTNSYFGRTPTIAELGPGDTLYVPRDWSYAYLCLEDAIFATEHVLSAEEGFEDAAVALKGSEFHRMKKFLEGDPEMRRGFRRFMGSARQMEKGLKKLKQKK